MNRYYPFFIPAGIFLFLKIINVGVRFSDTNIYFYTAYQLLQGQLLYKDIFFTNFPLFIYISALYHFLSGGNIYFYYFTAALEVTASAFIIYIITLHATKKSLIATMSSALYFFSYIVMATSDHQTGVFLGSLFAVLSYYFYQKKQLLVAGILVGCMLLTKAYFLPILLSYLLTIPFYSPRWKKEFLFFLIGVGGTSIVLIAPTLLFAGTEFYRDIVEYSLIRPQGISKSLIFGAIFKREFLLLAIFVTSLFFIKKYRFFGILSSLTIVFFLFYKDFYFYYFNITVPFLCIFFGYLYEKIVNAFHPQKFVIPTILILLFGVNFLQYSATTKNQKIQSFPEIVEKIKQFNPPVLYGANDITPLLAHETGIPLLQGVIDTNPTIFRKGFLNSKTMSDAALRQNALFIGHGIDYPEYNIRQDLVDEIFDKSLDLSKCSFIGNYQERTEGYENRLQLVTCQKK